MSKQDSTKVEHHEERPHLSDLVVGLLDARLGHVPYLETVGGTELRRMYRLQKERRRQDRTSERTSAAA